MRIFSYLLIDLILIQMIGILICQNSLEGPAPTTERVRIGTMESRGLWTRPNPNSLESTAKSPTILLVPGTGAQGPEEMIHPDLSADQQTHSFFQELSEPFVHAGFNTLALGKPGVNYFSSWELQHFFYDKDLYLSLRWKDLIQNVASAVEFLRQQPEVDPDKIFILSHAEGTQIAVDYSKQDPKIAGLLLLGYLGDDIATLTDWQLYRREVEILLKTDVDSNKDGKISRSEFQKKSHLISWKWKFPKKAATYSEIENALRKNPLLNSRFEKATYTPIWQGVFNRGPIHSLTASLSQKIYAYTGELDIQTPVSQILSLKEACVKAQKTNCFVEVVPGVGHGFSSHRNPKGHPFMDSTFGPVSPSFKSRLYQMARTI